VWVTVDTIRSFTIPRVNLMADFARLHSMGRQPAQGAQPAGDLTGPPGGEHVVVDRVIVGATESFEDFYFREFPHLKALARALVGPAYAEDVVQESLLVAYRRWEAIGAMSSPAGYLRGICVHKAATVTRRRAVEHRLWGRIAGRRTVEDATPEEELSDDTRVFWAQVRALPRRQAQAAALHYALDMSVADIAVVLDCAEGTIKAHLHRARSTLAAALGTSEEEQP
jgi:RNA polymerase sigma-70 factor (ECF subfamily)